VTSAFVKNVIAEPPGIHTFPSGGPSVRPASIGLYRALISFPSSKVQNVLFDSWSASVACAMRGSTVTPALITLQIAKGKSQANALMALFKVCLP
jgi:hypothetical protein